MLRDLEPDAEALIVNRMADPAQFAIAPIDRCYMLVGLVKLAWEGISGGAGRGGGDRGLLRRPAGGGRLSAAPEPEFQVLSASGRRHAAVPAVDFDVHVSEPGGRAVYAIALTAQVMIEPARRAYDDETRERLVELFGAPERWATTTRSLVWHQADALVPSFTGSTTFRLAVPASFDMEVASSKYLYGLPDGEVPLAFNFNGTVHYRDEDGRLQLSLVPWSCSAEYRLPVVGLARPDRPLLPEYRLDPAPGGHAAGAPGREGTARRCRPSTRAWRSCSPSRGPARRAGAMRSREQLVDTLLYEGYALYPYTPGATKNATPTPFGIVYPPAYAAGLDTTFDHLELRCMVEGGGEVSAEVHFLVPSGERHRAEPHRLEGSGDFDAGGLSVRTSG